MNDLSFHASQCQPYNLTSACSCIILRWATSTKLDSWASQRGPPRLRVHGHTLSPRGPPKNHHHHWAFEALMAHGKDDEGDRLAVQCGSRGLYRITRPASLTVETSCGRIRYRPPAGRVQYRRSISSATTAADQEINGRTDSKQFS